MPGCLTSGEPQLRFALLGPLAVSRDGVELDLGPAKQQMLLAYLLLQANRQVAIQDLVSALWGEDPPNSAVKNVQLYIGRLRRIFSAERSEPRLRTVNRGYSLSVGPGELDLERCRSLIDEGRRAREAGHNDLAEARFAHALNLWRGSPLTAFTDSVLFASEIHYLERLRLMLYVDYFQLRIEAGHCREVVPELQRLVLAHPGHEKLRFQLMLALVRSGDRSAALATYRNGYRLLVDAFGLEPSQPLRQLHESILAEHGSAA